MEKRVIPVLEMSCAVCAATVEKTVRELVGVEEASVNFSANTLQVVYDPDKISLKDMQAAVSAAGYDLVISENAEADAIDAERAARSKARAEEILAQKNLDKRDMELAEARLRRALVRSSVAARKDI